MKKMLLIMVLMLSGTLMFAQTKTAIKSTELQKASSDYIAKNYTGYAIEKAFKVDNKGIMNYEAIVKKGDVKNLLVFDKDGKFLRQESLKPEAKTTVQTAKKSEPKPAATPVKKDEKSTVKK